MMARKLGEKKTMSTHFPEQRLIFSVTPLFQDLLMISILGLHLDYLFDKKKNGFLLKNCHL